MGEILVRLSDSDLVGQIEMLARQRNVSPESEVTNLIRQAVQQQLRKSYLFENAKRIAAMTPKNVEQTDSVKLVREIRDSDGS
jgi:hypothetical protein